MSRALEGGHYCILHQGNHSHYDAENCTVCKQAAQIKELEAISAKYHELLYQVSMKFPNETRHETALRYLKRAENQSNSPVAQMERTKS